MVTCDIIEGGSRNPPPSVMPLSSSSAISMGLPANGPRGITPEGPEANTGVTVTKAPYQPRTGISPATDRGSAPTQRPGIGPTSPSGAPYRLVFNPFQGESFVERRMPYRGLKAARPLARPDARRPTTAHSPSARAAPQPPPHTRNTEEAATDRHSRPPPPAAVPAHTHTPAQQTTYNKNNRDATRFET